MRVRESKGCVWRGQEGYERKGEYRGLRGKGRGTDFRLLRES